MYRKCGALAFKSANDQGLSKHLEVLCESKVSYEVWSADEANCHYSEQLNVPMDQKCIYYRNGGAIEADLSLKTMQIQLPQSVNII